MLTQLITRVSADALRFSWKDRLAGILAAIAIVAAWWVPTAKRLRGDLFLQLIAINRNKAG